MIHPSRRNETAMETAARADDSTKAGAASAGRNADYRQRCTFYDPLWNLSEIHFRLYQHRSFLIYEFRKSDRNRNFVPVTHLKCFRALYEVPTVSLSHFVMFQDAESSFRMQHSLPNFAMKIIENQCFSCQVSSKFLGLLYLEFREYYVR